MRKALFPARTGQVRTCLLSVFLLLATGAGPLARPASALRIVSLAPSVTETLFAIGAGDEVVGVSEQCDYPPAATRVDRVGTFLKPNLETILAKQPDIVIAAPSPTNASFLDALEQFGVEVLLVESNSVREAATSILRIADAVGRNEAGHALVRNIQRDIEETQRRLAGTTPKRVLLVLGQQPLVAAGTGGLQDEIIRLAGGVNIAASAVGRWPRLDLEHVLAEQPEVIIDMTLPHDHPLATRPLGIWNAFPSIPAVRNGNVYGHPPNLLVRPGPRVAEAIDQVSRYVHPERFAGEPIDAR